MAQRREKGKIARGEWQKIVAQYEDGETIAQIGREYGCTAPAIRYIIKKTGKLRGDSTADGRPRVGIAADHRKLPSGTPRDASGHSDIQDANTQDVGQSGTRGSTGGRRSTNSDVLGLELRERVTADVAFFLVALDQAAAADTASLNVLRDATDSLMRSTARIRIELERLLAIRVDPDKNRDGKRNLVRLGTPRA